MSKDTYNLVNTIGFVIYDDNTIEIRIGGKFAPYAVYMNDIFILIIHKIIIANRSLEQVDYLLLKEI